MSEQLGGQWISGQESWSIKLNLQTMNREWTLKVQTVHSSMPINIRDWYFRCQVSRQNFSFSDLKESREISHTCNKVVITLSIITGKNQIKSAQHHLRQWQHYAYEAQLPQGVFVLWKLFA